MRIRACLVLAALSFSAAACSQAGSPVARDPGKVVPAKSFSVPGRLYAVKARGLYRFSGPKFQRLLPRSKVKDPAVTPDGTRLAFAQFGPDFSIIAVADTSLSEPQPITPQSAPEGAFWAVSPALSPDGSSLLFLTDRGKAKSDPGQVHPNDLAVWRYELAGKEATQLTWPIPYTGGDSDPVFRPGSERQLLYTRYSYDGDPPASVARLTWLSLASGEAISLSPSGARNFEPAFSPDGRSVAYIHAGPAGDDLYVMSLPPDFAAEPQAYPTESAVLIQSGMVAQPVWAPDGSAIAFLKLANGSFDLYIVPVSADQGVHTTGPPVAITSGSFLDADSRLAWAP